MEIKRKVWIVMSGDDVLCGNKNYHDFIPADKIKNEPINMFSSKGRALASAKRLWETHEIRAVEVEEIFKFKGLEE